MADAEETYEERQENEVELLSAVYVDDFKDLRDQDAWKIKRAPEVCLTLVPQQSMHGTADVYAKVDLHIKCPPNYPDVEPELDLKNSKGLSDDNLRQLKHELHKMAQQNLGEVMLLDLAQHVQTFLHAHNKPPRGSFYEEMMSNKRRQEEKVAREIQKKLDVQKRIQEKERRELEEEITRRQEMIKEEMRKRRSLKMEREDERDNGNSSSQQVSPKTSLSESPSTENLSQRRQGSPIKETPTRSRSQSGGGERQQSQDRLTVIRRQRSISESNSEPLEHQKYTGPQVLVFTTRGERSVSKGRCIGAGPRSSGSLVYVGMDNSSGQVVAIREWVLKWAHVSRKQASEHKDIARCLKQLSSCEQELLSLLKLDHPGLVRNLAMRHSQHQNTITVQLLMEYVGGGHLASCISNGMPVHLSVLHSYTEQLLDTLQYLHNKSVVHKDLRPSSVFLDSTGHLAVADYSIEKRFGDLYTAVNTGHGGVRFSDDKVQARPSKREDILRLGMLILSLYLGEEVTEYPVKIPSDLPSDFQDFISRCCETDERARWSTQQLLDHPFLKPTVADVLTQADNNQAPSNQGGPGVQEEDSPADTSGVDPSDLSWQSRSRLHNEFEELEWLGKGGFGDVIKVKNKLDGCMYAIKRIPLDPKSKAFNRKITREVKLLSRLNHENVVRYYNSWIERIELDSEDDPGRFTPSSEFTQSPADQGKAHKQEMFLKNHMSMSDDIERLAPQIPADSVEWSTSVDRSSSRRMEDSEEDSSSSDEEDVFGTSFLPDPDSDDSSDGVVFEHSFRNPDFVGVDDDDESDQESQLFEPSFSTLSLAVKSSHKKKKRKTAQNLDDDDDDVDTAQQKPCFKSILYMQMEYCDKSTLRNIIDAGLYTDEKRVWRLFRETLEGLAHIHEQGMIHRDLKPVNIFLDSNDHVKIGDFGLATSHTFGKGNQILETPLQALHEITGSSSLSGDLGSGGLTGKVGTALYISPELCLPSPKITYNQKVDMYSLGIIFFEMCYQPLTTGMERVQIIGNLRMESVQFPDDFDEVQMPGQHHITRWLLDHDPGKRPTARELLQSEYLPPPQMEDSQLGEVLRHTLSNTQSLAYRRLMSELFSQPVTAIADYTFDMDIYKGQFSTSSVLVQRVVEDKIASIFQRHGGTKVHTALLMPKTKLYEQSDMCANMMDPGGCLLGLPFDLRVPFARFLARNNVTSLKRYSLGRVYRGKKLLGSHPKELWEFAFDIVTPSGNSQIPDAEVLHVVSEVINEFPPLQERNYVIRLNHTSILTAILTHCGVPEDIHMEVYSILREAKVEKLRKLQVQTRLCSLSLSDQTVECLFRYVEQEGPVNKISSLLKSLTKNKGQVGALAKQGLHELQTIISHAETLEVKQQMIVSLGLVYNVHHFCGLVFQFMAETPKSKKRVGMDVLAAGGRYDKLISQFKRPSMTSVPGPAAVGVSIAFEKVVSAVSDHTESGQVPSTCDILVCTIGRSSLLKERMRVVRDLWAAGLRAEILYDSMQSPEEIQDHCKQAGILHMVILNIKDHESDMVRVRSFDKDKVVEKKVSVSDLVECLQQKLLAGKQESSDAGQSNTGKSSGTSGADEPNSNKLKSGPPINVTFIPLDKLSSNNRRRFEAQIMSRLQPVLQGTIAPKTVVEVVAVELQSQLVKTIAATLEFDDEDVFEESMHTLMSKQPKQKKYLSRICETIREVKIDAVVPVSVLFSYKDDYYRLLF
ncbi:eIF-2-alpha kinase GCN2-like isoform X1 [Branchiostoma floridae x Branchiostoma japonicum]